MAAARIIDKLYNPASSLPAVIILLENAETRSSKIEMTFLSPLNGLFQNVT